ncbi:MAG: GGDEF domain-containing protein [Pseudomonadota bacterium]|nr:GGDEF domain-containing protein [Pseudomonadota bacterium]
MLDLQTYLLIIGIGNLSFAALMTAYARGPGTPPALRTWMWARVVLGICQSASWGNLELESALLAQVIALGWIAGMALDLSAYCLFFRYTHWRRPLIATTVVSMVVVAGAQLYGISLVALIALIALVVALFDCAMGTTLLWPRGGTPALQRIIGINDAVLALSLVVWVWSGTREAGTLALGNAHLQSVVFFAGYVRMIVKGFGFLLLCKQEDDRKMLHLATVDSLTGLLNRYAFFDQAQALRDTPPGTARMSLLMLDLDHFKRINDNFGHATGDAALRLFADTVRTILNGRGILGRFGGEEFVLALTCPLDDALQVAEQLRAAVTGALLATETAPCTMTVSIGVASLVAGETVAGGLERADQALYDAKRGGRNCVAWRALSLQDVEIKPAMGQAGIAVTGHEHAILRGCDTRPQFCV